MFLYLKRLSRRNKALGWAFSITMVVLSALLQTFVISVFIKPCHLISGGFTGIALFLSDMAARAGLDLNLSFLVLLLNIPVALFCYKTLSKRFVILSVLQFSLFSLLNLLWHPKPIFDDLLLNILFGGICMGFASALALNAGGSTGGSDFIAQYVGTKMHRSIFHLVFYANCLMFLLYGFSAGWKYAGYSIVFQFISTEMINHAYKRYGYSTIEITCKNYKEVVDEFTRLCHHGISVFPILGGYSGEKFFVCQSVVSSDEVPDIVEGLRKMNPKLIINVYKSESFVGSFRLKPIDQI